MSTVGVRREAALRDAGLTTVRSAAVSPPLSGDWGAPPRIAALVAADADDADTLYGGGDSIWLHFDKPTDQPAASSRVEIDRLLGFSQARTVAPRPSPPPLTLTRLALTRLTAALLPTGLGG